MSGAIQALRGGDLRAETARRLAQVAGKMALELFESRQVAWKCDGSMVTSADIEIQTWLEREIGEAFPGDAVLGEEGLERGPRRLDAEHVWVLDPIDGTNNFGRGISGFCVSVGILRHGMPFAGAVFDPIADQLFTACVGEGARCNERPLRVEPVELSDRSLFSIRTPWPEGVPSYVEGWMRRHRMRRLGSTALQLCYVALGALAFVHDHGASLWDLAGAAPVVTEAGALITAPEGGPLFPIEPSRYRGQALSFLAGDPAAHKEALVSIAT
jgi:myo-inositol-1(or 4)-monophosphatase